MTAAAGESVAYQSNNRINSSKMTAKIDVMAEHIEISKIGISMPLRRKYQQVAKLAAMS